MPRTQNHTSPHAFWLAALSAAVMGIAVIGVWTLLDNRAREHLDSITDSEVRMSEVLIQKDIDRRLTALNRIAQRWTTAAGIPQQIWEADADRYLLDMPGFNSIEWADATLRVRWSVPFSGKYPPLEDVDFSQDASARLAINAARESDQVRLSQPVENPMGDLGILAYAPVARDGQFDGVIIGRLKLKPWLDSVFDGFKSTEYQTRIFLNEQETYQHGDVGTTLDETWTRRSEFEIQGLRWTTVVSPSNELVSAVHSSGTLFILTVSLLSALFGLLVHQLLTSRTRARELHDTASQLATLFQNLPGMAYRVVLGTGVQIEFLSEGCHPLTGYSAAEFSEGHVTFLKLVHPDDRNRVRQTVRDAVDANQIYDLEYRILTKGNQERWLEHRGRAVGSLAEDAFLLEGFISDITDRKLAEMKLTEVRALQREAEETLRREHERLTVIIEHAHMGIVSYRFEQPFLTANRAFCRITGYTVDELKKMTVADLTHPDDRADSARLLAKAKLGEIDQFSQKKRYLRKDGNVINLQVVNAITHDAAGNIDLFIGQAEDLTPRLAAEAEARQHREQLAHVERLNVLGEMASGIAHEINQPLTAISLFSQAGKRLLDGGNFERLPDVFDKLSKHAQRAGAIIERIQAMTRQRESAKEVIDCNALVMEVAQLAEAEAHIRDIDIAVELNAEKLPVAVDSVQIQQVALNLLRNGMEAMRSVDCRHGDTILLKTTRCEDGDVMVEVVDSGSGVSEEAAAKLFQLFSTSKESGMGMGLSISRAIITAHGGQLNYKNNESGGATFSFNLPAATLGKQNG